MAKNIYGGGANTNINGLSFEEQCDLKAFFISKGYQVDSNVVHNTDGKVGLIFQKHGFYKDILRPHGIEWSERASKKLLPDDGFFEFSTGKLTIIEKKCQYGAGSVDEKLQTCHYKLEQYRKMIGGDKIFGVAPSIRLVYVLNDWFNQPSYRDVLAYIREVGCDYHFNEIPAHIITSQTNSVVLTVKEK